MHIPSPAHPEHWCAQTHPGLGCARAQKLLYSRPAGGLLVASHAKANPSLAQQRHQPGRRVAPVKQQNIIWAQALQRLHQHRPLRCVGAVYTGVQSEFGIWQIKRKQALIATGCKARTMALANGGHQHAGIGCHQPQATPALDDTGGLCAINHPIVEPIQCGHMQMRARLGKSTIRYATNHFSSAASYAGVKIGEEGIEKRLLGACAHRQQRCNKCWQRQFAVSAKGFGETGMSRPVGKII